MRGTRRLSLPAVIASTAAVVIAVVIELAASAMATYTTQPVSLAWSPAGPVHSSVSRGGIVYVGGKLDGTGGIAALDAATGSVLWRVSANGDVRALALSPDGSRLFAGGSFTTMDDQSHTRLAVIDLADHSVVAGWDGTASGMVRDLVVDSDRLFVAGSFAKLDGVADKGIGALHATTGARDPAFTHATDHAVEGLALTPTSLLMAGKFTQVDGQPRAALASIDLSTDSLTSWAPAPFCSCATYWDVQTDGTWAYVAASGGGGNFTAYNLTTGAQRWPHVHADGDIQAVWLPGDGNAYVGGHFGQQISRTGSSGSAVAATLVAAVDLTTGLPDPSFTPKIYKTYPGVWAMTSTAHRLWVGGDFTGELQNGVNNHAPYLAAYRSPNAHSCQGRPATIVGTAGDDVLDGTPGADVIVALAGADTIRGGGGHDTICAGKGNDVVKGGAGRDSAFGGAGADRLAGGPGADTLVAGTGADRLAGKDGNDSLDARDGVGDDTLRGGHGRDTSSADRGDTVRSCP